jgi:SpoVK/Ycf46/Vps4 family AAA+-type ATPase
MEDKIIRKVNRMVIERLDLNLRFDLGQRFFILYGPGISGRFLTTDYAELGIEEVLWRILKERSYERIVFCSADHRIYFLDEESKNLCQPGSRKSQSETGYPRMKRLRGGPLGDLVLFRTGSPNCQPGSSSGREIYSSTEQQHFTQGIGAVNAIRFLDAVISDEKVRTAIVMRSAETTLLHFPQPELLSVRLSRWMELPASNKNVCLFIFESGSYERLRSNAEDLEREGRISPLLRELIANMKNRSYEVFVGYPEEQEIQRLIDYARLRYGVKVNWAERDKLATWMSAEGKSITEWIQCLQAARKLDKETAKERNWFNHFSSDDRSAMEKLESLIGLEPVKRRIKELANLAKVGWVGKEPPSFHMVFTGNPGTGKTTVARLVGEIFCEIGLLKRGHLVECNGRADLVAGYVGQTAPKVKEKVCEAMDGILFIDEAYTLAEGGEGDFGKEAIEQLLQEAENNRDRLVVILAGYPDKMKEFLKTNPGLTRRFPEDNIIHFPDYTPDELMQILLYMLRESGLTWTEEAEKALREVVKGLWKTRDERFGNAGEMRNLRDALYRQWATRVTSIIDKIINSGKPLDEAREEARKEPIRPEDIPETYRRFLQPPIPEIESLMAGLDRMIGLEELKQFVRDLRNLTELDQKRREKGVSVEPRRLHMVFAGNPGTGKTTAARLMGKIFRALGILRKGHIVECSKADVVGEYVGHTPRLVQKKLEEALDGVLFIDEAYSLLGGGDFGKEAIDQLTQQMENLKDRLVVIVAGYPEEMKRFLESNPGLSSRFALHVHFRDFTKDELGEILKRMTEEKGYKVSQEAMEKAIAYLEAKRQADPRTFGNARDVSNLLEEMERRLASRLSKHLNEVQEFIFQPEDVPDFGTTPSAPIYPVCKDFELVSLLPLEGGPSNLEEARKSVLYLKVLTTSGEETSGTGFLVTAEGHFLTAYHVVEGASHIVASFEAEPEKFIQTQLLGWDKEADLAVLQLSEQKVYPYVLLVEQGYRPSLGEEVGVLSYPLGEELGREITFTKGTVSSLREVEGIELIQTDAVATHGSSGAPVFRLKDWRVVGVVHGGIKQEIASGLNFAVSIQEVYCRFCASLQKVRLYQSRQIKPLPTQKPKRR